MVLHRKSGDISHHTFKELPSLLRRQLLSRSMKRRSHLSCGRCHKQSGGRVLCRTCAWSSNFRDFTEPVCLVRSSKPLRPGPNRWGCHLETVSPGRSRIRFPVREADLSDFLDLWSPSFLLPDLEPRRRTLNGIVPGTKPFTRRITGSVAAPMALHFTDDLLEGLERQGTNRAEDLASRRTCHLHPGQSRRHPVSSHGN